MKLISVVLLILCVSSFTATASKLDKFKIKAKDKFGVEREYFTGYVPNPSKFAHSQYRDFPAKLGATPFGVIPKEFSMKDNVQRIFSQQCGDCWAQGATTAFETLISFSDKVSTFISRQQVIDCSGFGGCGGGQISVENFKAPKGSVYESDYPYKGYDQKCKSGLSYHQKAQDAFMVKTLTWSNLQRALMETGPLEICGSASALGNGGWVSKNPSGSTNHCYGLVGWYDGATHGKPAGSYGIIANSWGTNWGDGGFGYYLLAKDGENFDGDIITEAGGLIYKPACTPQPKADAGADQNIVRSPSMPQNAVLGTPAIEGANYSWLPADGLSDSHAAMPIASPAKSMTYTVTVTNKCGVSQANVKIHVFNEVVGGKLREIK